MFCECRDDVTYHELFYSDNKSVDLSFNDWLDGIQKSVKRSIKETEDKEANGKIYNCLFINFRTCMWKIKNI